MLVNFRISACSREGRERDLRGKGERGKRGVGVFFFAYEIFYKDAGINKALDPSQNFWFQRIRLPAVEEEAIRRFDVVRPCESRKESSVDSTGNGALDVRAKEGEY